MSSPEAEPRLRQQGADVDSLYEISSRIEGKVDALDAKVDQLAEGTSDRLDALGARFEAHDARFDALERSNEQTQALLARILERLDRD